MAEMREQSARSDALDPAAELLDKIRHSDRPIAISKLRTGNLPPLECKGALDHLINEGRIHSWRSGKAAYVWHTSAEDHASAAALHAAREIGMPRGELAATVAARCFRLFSRSNCEAVLKKLLQSGELRELPKPGGPTAKAKVVFATASPNAYLRTLAAYANALIVKAEEAGASRDEFFKALGGRGNKELRGEPLTERVYRALERHQLSPGAHVAIGAVREDRDLMSVSKSDFDAAVLRLADDQRIELAAHDDAYHLSEQQREMLVFERPDRYYVAVATRRS